jgi:hypothetical protein
LFDEAGVFELFHFETGDARELKKIMRKFSFRVTGILGCHCDCTCLCVCVCVCSVALHSPHTRMMSPIPHVYIGMFVNCP